MKHQPHARTMQHALALQLAAGNIPAAAPVRPSQPRNPAGRIRIARNPNNGV